ncbi:PREDICTED: putative F-box protein At3g17500 [Camelina sativa]|uniref:F-box protein At3g17500 n=1 Tax=Camelina sativa TaxID=90675 RepID=A0ABM0T1H6_CAMSA|nr:PREDICTED: putative F-box protein At3g17500 [Camelina sativa]
MLPNLPPELVEEILSRVQATTLTRLRSTCKLWNSLFQDKRFVEKHKHLAKQFGVLMLKDYRVCPMSVGNLHDEINKNVAAPSRELKEGFDLKDSRLKSSDQVDVSEIFQCEGLLLCTTKDNSLVAWNPCTGQTRWIQHSLLNKRKSMFFLGYGNNKSCRNYKILRYWDDGKLCKQVVEFEIYDFSSDSWRVLNDVTCNCIPQLNGMSLKGNTYCFGLYKV